MSFAFVDIGYFFVNFCILGACAFASFYIVNDSLKAPVRKVFFAVFLFDFLYCLLSTAFNGYGLQAGGRLPAVVEVLYYIHPLAAVVVGLALYFHFVDETRDKLVFILLLVAHAAFMCYDIITAVLSVQRISENEIPLLLVSLLVLGLIWPMRKLWLGIRSLTDTKWYRFCLIPIFFIAISLSSRSVYYMNVAAVDRFMNFATTLTISVCAVVVYYLLVWALRRGAEKARMEEHLRNLDNYLSQEAEHMREIVRHMEEIRVMRHDMRHHVVTLGGMLDAGENARARTYLAQLENEQLPGGQLLLCENFVVDSVVSRYAAAAKRQGTALDIRLAIPQGESIRGADLGILFGNLMENAVEATAPLGEGGYIKVYGRMDENRLLLEIENNFIGEVRKKNGAYLSRKEEGRVGMGIRSAKSIAEKYWGGVQFFCEGSRFTARVVLYPEKAEAAPPRSE